ncbi:MAG: SMC-Scp complex subunit ScpB [Oscillatoriales cyanobacterium SM2_2_1]|nr:SMC-Scp complex subunit ScpB [Oscillatoriales cyanobacterium SM2_2_1]
MDDHSLKLRIEAILYLKGQPLTLGAIAELLSCSAAEAESGLLDLIADYAHRDTALEIQDTATGFALRLREDFAPLLQRVVPSDLGLGALRTLAAIALKNPITQAELVELRGSGAYDHVRELIELGFIRKRRQSDGRSYWLQVTDKFHQYFDLNDQALAIAPAKNHLDSPVNPPHPVLNPEVPIDPPELPV